jgi:chromosome segregation ATPase
MVFQPRPIIVAGCLLALAGCSSDPNQAGFLSGVYNMASGTYDQQAAELEAEATAAEQRRTELRGEAQRLDAEIAQLQPEQQRLQQALASLNRQLATQSQRLSQARAEEAAQQSELERLRAREAELSQRQIALGNSPDSATRGDIEALERDNGQLQEDIDAFFAAVQ